MGRFMRTAVVCGCAGVGIFVRDLNAMFLYLTIRPLMMQMAIVKVIRMSIMLHRRMSTVRSMLVFVILVQM